MSRMVQLNELLHKSQLESYYGFDSLGGDGLPKNSKFIIMEAYCENPSCNCNELIAEIFQTNDDRIPIGKSLAIIKYSWVGKKQCKPILYEQSQKTEIALILLKVYKQFIHDKKYLLRIKEHYSRVKELSAEKILNEKELSTQKKKMGRNDLCPCGSNKKYKKCCLAK